MAKRPGKKRKFLFVFEILVLVIFIGGLYVYGQITTRLDKIEQPVINEEKIIVNEEVKEFIEQDSAQATGFTTYALFGIDYRAKNKALGGMNSDTIIIASVNNDTKDVRLVSVYRDTLLNIDTEKDAYSKANAAYALGGPEQAISMLNTNLDLNIQDYATVDFNALSTVIDCIGGLDIPMSYAELVFMNDYCVETSEQTDKEYVPIELPERPENIEETLGTYHLNGVQATSYCRIRYTASLDMGRTERQRRVIQMIVAKAKTAGLTRVFNIMDEVLPMVTTSVTKTEILQMAPTLIGYSLNDTMGFPFDYKFANVNGSVIVPMDLESNVKKLHEFLYGETDYVPSQRVIDRSSKIIEVVGGAENIQDVAPVVDEDDGSGFIWQDGQVDTWEGYDDQLSDGSDYDYGTGGTDTDYGTGGTDPDYGTGGTDPDYGTGGDDYDYGTGGTDPDYGTGGDDYDYGTGGTDPDYGSGTGADMDYGAIDSGTSGMIDSGTETEQQLLEETEPAA